MAIIAAEKMDGSGPAAPVPLPRAGPAAEPRPAGAAAVQRGRLGVGHIFYHR